MNPDRKIKVLISGGGTGGHVFPAIAIANAIKEIHENAEILFVGANGKIEMDKVPKAGYTIKGLWISGFHRKLNLRNIFRNLLFPIKLIASLLKARGIVKKFKPDVVVGVGGFASGPTLEIASRMYIPCLLQEQNFFAGKTNRLLSNKASTICVAYDNMDKIFPKEKLVLTGNPVRQGIWNSNVTRNQAVRHFNLLDSKKIIMLVGGSLGAKSLNEAMRANHDLLSQHPEVQILWQCGKLYIDEFSQCKTAALPNVKITAFIDRMDLAYAMSDLVIARAGALTISELCLVGRPTLLVPSPNVAEDHQTYNARALVEKGAAIMLNDKEASEKIISESLKILNDSEKQTTLKENILLLAKPKADKEIAREVLKLIS